MLQFPLLNTLLIQWLNLLVKGAFTFGIGVDGPTKRAIRRAYLDPFPTFSSRKAMSRFPKMVPLSPKAGSYHHLKRIESALPSLGISTLILKGDRDPVLTAQRAHRLRELIPRSRLQIIPKAGHFLQEEQPQAVAEAVRFFLEA